MTATNVSLPAIKNAIREVCFALDENEWQSPSWARMTEDDLWRELVACILGSRVLFEIAHSALERITKRRLLCQERRSSRFDHYERNKLGTNWGHILNIKY